MAATFPRGAFLVLVAVVAAGAGQPVGLAQDGVAKPQAAGRQQANVGFGNGIGQGQGLGLPGDGAEGGAAAADFDTLIDLITSTVDAESWEENGTGAGQIMPFDISGVYVDAAGALRMRAGGERAALTSIRAQGVRPPVANGRRPHRTTAAKPSHADADLQLARQPSALRFVSLPRLEAAIADSQRRHAPLDPAMLSLAGLQRVSYVLVYPEAGDLVLAGPAGDWQRGRGGSIISADTGRPLVRLDDLVALWRRQRTEKSSAFGCSIVPRQEALARTQEYLAASAGKPLEPSDRRAWLEGLREALGVQDVEYYNIDPDSRIASLLLAADYHMKLVGMGLAKSVPGVWSYLSTVRLGPNGQPPAMTVLRWWFAMPSAVVEAAAEGDAFAMPERCIQVLSENELLAARGERVHTGESEDLNRKFAESFTRQYTALADKYPVYGELERVFELALALALVEQEKLTEKVAWTPSLLLDGDRLRLPSVPAPRAVETVINHRVIAGRHIVAGVSGGVWVDGGKSLAVAAADSTAKFVSVKKARREGAANLQWWWD